MSESELDERRVVVLKTMLRMKEKENMLLR